MLSDAINDQLRTVLGPSGKRPAYIAERVKKTWELGDGWAKHVTVEVALGTREGSSVRGGSLGGLHDGALADAATVDKVIDAAVAAVAARNGVAVSLPRPPAAVAVVVDSAALGEFAEQVTGRDGVLASAARLVLDQLGLDDAGHHAASDDRRRADRPGHRRTRFGLAATGGAGVRRQEGRPVRRPLGQRPRGPGQALADRRRRDRRRLAAALGALRGRRARRRHPGRAGGRARRWPPAATCTRRCSAGSPPARRTRARAATATRSPSSPARPRARSRRRWSRQLLGGGATVIATTSRLDDDRLAFYRDAVPRPRPLRRGAVGGAGQHGVLLRHRRAGAVGRHRADRKPWAAVDSPQGRADPDAAVPVRGAAGGRRPVRRRCPRPRWR